MDGGASAILCAALACAAARPCQAQTAAAQPPAAAPAATQTLPAPARRKAAGEAENKKAPAPVTTPTVTVTARLKPKDEYGAVVGDIEPELQMSPADIQSYGVSTVTELLNEIAPQTRSDRGRNASTAPPVLLLNGRRISSLNEIQNIPTEAILRVDILPEEVSLKYGYTADQRVVNFVLKPQFRAVTGEVVGGKTTEGGDATGQAEVDQFKVRPGHAAEPRPEVSGRRRADRRPARDQRDGVRRAVRLCRQRRLADGRPDRPGAQRPGRASR